MNLDKETRYQELVEARKKCRLCKSKPDYELINPASIMVDNQELDSCEIGPWSLWHSDLNAKVLIIGKDFGSVGYFIKHQGFDKIGNPTNTTLVNDLSFAGISLSAPQKTPYQPDKKSGLFFSNSVLCLAKDCKDKTNESMKTKIYPEWIKTCSLQYLRNLIEIISPEIIIPVGKEATFAVAVALNRQQAWCIDDNLQFSLTPQVAQHKQLNVNAISIFPVFHPSHRHINRPPELNKIDWARIKQAYLGGQAHET